MELNIIAIDDQTLNLLVLEEMAEIIGFKITTFLSPLDALNYIENHEIDIMITDYTMPVMDGLTLISKTKEINPDIICVMVTAVSDNISLKIAALECGATDFLTKPIDIPELQAKIKNLSELRKSQKILKNFNTSLKNEVNLAIKNLVDREYEMLQILSATAEYRDPETGFHITRVAHYSKLLAKFYGLSEEEQNIIFHASPLHDIGKVGIADFILLKPGKLTHEEYEVMKTHSMIGYNILCNSKNHLLQAGAIIAKTHHEKYDGSGYPFGLQKEEIHIFGRITALADVFDALTSIRPYKKAWSFNEGLDFIKDCSGAHFDPVLVDLFILNKDDFFNIYTQFQEKGE